MDEIMIQMDGINKVYKIEAEEKFILKDVSIQVKKGELIAIMGKSGAGKSTLLHILGLLDSPSSGEYMLGNQMVGDIKEKKKARIRNHSIGFVFQNFHLVKELSAMENVELSLQMGNIYRKRKMRAEQRNSKSQDVLEKVGLQECLHKYPSQLSGGQKQRVAIARALVGEPELILADEPTGALDRDTGKEVMNLFHQMHEMGKTVLIVTHDKDVAEQCDRIIEMADGTVIRDTCSLA